MVETIERGSFVGFDRCGFTSSEADLEQQLDNLATLVRQGYGSRIFLAHDNLCFMDSLTNEELGAMLPNFPYGYIEAGVLPGLRARGVTQEQLGEMLIANPAAYFSGTG